MRLPSNTITAFLNQYPPVAAVKGNNRIELEFTAETPTEPPRGDDEGGQGGSSDTTPDSGGTPTTPASQSTPANDQQQNQNVSEDTAQAETQRATRTASPTSSSPQPESRTPQPDEPDAETPGMTDEQKMEMTVDRVADFVVTDIQQGIDGNEALDKQTKTSIWHGHELYALGTFEGQSEEQIRDYFRKEIADEVNQRGLSGRVGRGFKMLKQPEPLATPEETPTPEEPSEPKITIRRYAEDFDEQGNRIFVDSGEVRDAKGNLIEETESQPEETPTPEEPTNDPTELLSRLTDAEIQQTENQSGLLTFSLGSQVTAEIKKGTYDNQKSGIVRFYLSDNAPPIEKHYRGKALPPEAIVATLRQELTVDDVQSALGQPVTVNGVTYTPDNFQMHTQSGYVEATGFRVDIPDHAYAEFIVHPQYQKNKKGQDRWNSEWWQVSDSQTGLALPQSAGETRYEAVEKARATLEKVGEAQYTETVANLLAEREAQQETPEEKVSVPAPATVEEDLSPELQDEQAARTAEEQRNAPEADATLKDDLKKRYPSRHREQTL